MKTQATLSLLLVSALSSLSSAAADKHVHGEAEFFIAIESNKILIEMESPAANIIGFEHAPRSSQQKAILKSSIETLQDHKNIAEVVGGDCKQTDAFVKSPFAENITSPSKNDHDEHKHEHHEAKSGKHDHEEAKEETHSEFHVTYTLECKNSSDAKALTLNVFKNFPKIMDMQVNWAGTKGQGSQKASAKKITVKLN